MGGDRRDVELPPLTNTYGSKPCSANEYWGGRSVGRREEVTRRRTHPEPGEREREQNIYHPVAAII